MPTGDPCPHCRRMPCVCRPDDAAQPFYDSLLAGSNPTRGREDPRVVAARREGAAYALNKLADGILEESAMLLGGMGALRNVVRALRKEAQQYLDGTLEVPSRDE